MRTLLALLIICFGSSYSTAQTHGTVFTRTYKETGRGTYLNSIHPTSDGGYIAIGTAYSPDFQVVVLKLDSGGRALWQNNYAVAGEASQAVCIQETVSGYIALVSLGPVGIDQMMMVMRIDSAGALLWQNTYPSSGGVIPFYIEPTADGGYLVSAEQYASDDYSLWGLKLDGTGAIVWQKAFGTYAGLGAIHATADGGAIVAGGTPSGDTYAGRILKLDAAGNPEWDRFYTFPFETFFTSVRPTPDHGFIVSGYFEYKNILASKALLVKLDAAGNVSSTFAYASRSCPGENAFEAFNMVGGGYLFRLGSCNGSTDSVARIDGSGSILWQRAPSNVSEIGISPTLDGGYIAAGQAVDMLVVKADAAGTLPGCVQNGSTDLQPVEAPPVVVTDVHGPTVDTFTHPIPVVVARAPAQLITQTSCVP